MSDKQTLLKVRKEKKDKKPEFKQQNFGRKKRVSNRWRRPKGIQSKMRHQFKGYPSLIKKGWRSPAEVRNLSQKGLIPILIHNVSELKEVTKDHGVIIASGVGNKKRLEIINHALSQNLTIINIKADKFKEKLEKSREDQKKEKLERTEKKKKTIEDSLKKAEKKEKDKEKKDKTEDTKEKTTDEIKAEEKKVKDDVLIHKE